MRSTIATTSTGVGAYRHGGIKCNRELTNLRALHVRRFPARYSPVRLAAALGSWRTAAIPPYKRSVLAGTNGSPVHTVSTSGHKRSVPAGTNAQYQRAASRYY
eukprot:3677535-Rhodomonas_salina.5